MSFKSKARTYYRLTKPGIVYGNTFAALAGYFYGAAGEFDLLKFASLSVGLSTIIASACVFNNILDRSIDAKMARTSRRPLVTHEVGVKSALLFGSVLLLFGSATLLLGTNLLSLAVAIAGHVAYVVLYGWAKRVTVHSTLIGTISGSTPPVIGYAAATGHLDHIALLLFVLLVAWQMPHFYAIAIFRRDEYASAGLPILSVMKGTAATRRQIIAYTALFWFSCAIMGIYGGASIFWTLLMLLVAAYWLYLVLLPPLDMNKWARKQFGWSLMTLLILCVSLSLDRFWH